MDFRNRLNSNNSPILNDSRFRKTAVLLPLFFDGTQWQILFQVRAQGIAQGGEIGLPGGRWEAAKDLNLEDTALRETYEEMGIHRSHIEVVGDMGAMISISGTWIQVFVGILQIQSMDEIVISKEEVERCFAMPLAYFQMNQPVIYPIAVFASTERMNQLGEKIELFPAKALGLPQKYHQQWEMQPQEVVTYATEEGVIWGITGEIIYRFIQKMHPN